LKYIFIIIFLFITACSELNLANHLSKKIIRTSKENIINDDDDNNKSKSIKPIYKIGSPYYINGIKYTPKEEKNYIEEGIASWYGPNFDGKQTANGEIFNQYDISAAHKTLPLPSLLRVTNLENGRQVIVRVNDRGPFVGNRIIDLSFRSAQILGVIEKGIATVRLELIDYGPHLLEKNNNKNKITKQNSYLQIGVFKNANNADKLYAKLRNIGYLNNKVFIETVDSDNSTFYVVKVGPINNKENIMYVQRKLKKNEIESKIIIE